MSLNQNEPLGLPDGSVRALLAFIVVIGAGAIFAFTDKLTFVDLIAVVTPVLTLYFGQYLAKPGLGTAVEAKTVTKKR